MGYEVLRFQTEVDEELLCCICCCVLEAPLQAPICEHAFCEVCILEWLKQQSVCPHCRQHLQPDDLKPVPRILRNLLQKLQLHCDFASLGCQTIVKLEELNTHVEECFYNPKKPIYCEAGCGMAVARDQIQDHSCIEAMRELIEEQKACVAELRREQFELHNQVTEQRREIGSLKDCLRAAATNNLQILQPCFLNNNLSGQSLISVSTHRDAVTSEDVLRWVGSLRPGRVTRWGGMISTPDTVLQAVIRRALLESSVPHDIIDNLMENSHERSWPIGLSTLEIRQINRRLFDNFVVKRIPGKQAVVIMNCENRHMPADCIIEPGIVMIFAHGVE